MFELRSGSAVGSKVPDLPARQRMFCLRRPQAADEHGVALIEFALVLPMVLLLLLGMIDVGKAVNYWNDETHLANEAARFAAVNNSPTKDASGNAVPRSLNAAIVNEADSAELRSGGSSVSKSDGTPGGVSVCIYFPAGTHNVNDPVKVVVKAQYNWLGYLVGKGVRANSGLTATSTMRIEQPPTDPTDSTSANTNAYIASSSC